MKKRELLRLAEPMYDEDQLAELSSAIDFATEKHASQKRLSGEPYVTHPSGSCWTIGWIGVWI